MPSQEIEKTLLIKFIKKNPIGKLRINWNFLNLLNDIYKKLLQIYSMVKLKTFPLKLGST